MAELVHILGTMTFADQADGMASLTMLEKFSKAGNNQLDTAYVYNNGATELLLGNIIDVNRRSDFYIASKVNPWNDNGLKAKEVERQLQVSLSRLKTSYVDLLYLHAPDLDTPIEKTLKACWQLYCEGKFKQFGLSNYAAWQVAEIAQLCVTNDWMMPVVYQGMYNALTRDVERELFPCLRNYGIKFYVYNPLAGGLLTGKYTSYNQRPDQGRFASYEGYQQRYWKKEYFKVIEHFNQLCFKHNIDASDAALRWLHFHSKLSADYGDGIILGASRVEHLEKNLKSYRQGMLPAEIVESLEQGWQTVRANCIPYFRT